MWMNVSEWCLDWYDDEMEWGDVPREVRSPVGPRTGEHKCFRGGSPVSGGWPRCSYRGFQAPTFRHFQLGFRLVRNLASASREGANGADRRAIRR